MPKRLRPTAPVAADAILVGDPGRALMLAQELLEQPKMSNHARGLWGYSGRTPDGKELTIQSTGIGGPSAAAVLADLAKLGVRRAVRVGTCTAAGDGGRLGELLLVAEAIARGGSAAAFGVRPGGSARPDPALLEGLRRSLGAAVPTARVASYDTTPHAPQEAGAEAADLQTVAVLAEGAQLGLLVAAVLVVAERAAERISDEALESAAKRAGKAAAEALSKVEVEP